MENPPNLYFWGCFDEKWWEVPFSYRRGITFGYLFWDKSGHYLKTFHLKGEIYVSSFNPKGVFVQGNKFQMRFPAKKGVALCLVLREELKMLKLIVDVVLLLPRKVIEKQVSRNDVELSIPWTLKTANKCCCIAFHFLHFVEVYTNEL